MIDNELKLLTNWRFVPINRGEKGPRSKDWQKKHYTLDQVPQHSNVGVILGPASGGILAIDFDGPWAWEYWLEHIKIPFTEIDTVTWTSNKPGRCQMAFQVHPDFWHHMPVKFAINGPIGTDGKTQQLEFRWGNDDAGFQSVLPPSIHPDTIKDPNIYYNWVRSPSQVSVQQAPADLLEWIYNYKIEKEPDVVEVVDYPKNTPEDVAKIAEEFNQLYPRLDYDTWIRVTWAFCHALGTSDGVMLMKYYYPELKGGEYKKLTSSKYTGKKVTIATIIKMIKDRKGQLASNKTTKYQMLVEDMKLLSKILKEKRNGREHKSGNSTEESD